MDKKKIWIILGVIVTLFVVGGISFAYWNRLFIQKDENALITDCFKITFEEDLSSNINLEKAYPIRDEEGSFLKPYKFSIRNVCTSTGTYQINMESLEGSTMPNRVLKAKVNQETGVLLREEIEVEPTIGVQAYQLFTGVIYPNETKHFEVRVWMDESTTMADTDAMDKTFVGKVTITATYSKEKYQESILNGTDPVLKEGLIPVTIDNDGLVKKASESDKWYSYEEKIWANAVILNDESLNYQNGEVIPEDNIESYFVWIPKYRYQLWDLGNYSNLTNIENDKLHEIPVIFGDYNTNDNVDGECTTPMMSGVSGNCEVGDYMTHPAFLSFGVNGMWVGKFETGYKGSIDKSSAESNRNEPEKVQIKPNVNSWRGINVSNAYVTSFDYKRNLDSHMMKNTEWGAVAYLQHSKYGNEAQIRVNNYEHYVTGYASTTEAMCGNSIMCEQYQTESSFTQPWNTSVGYLASTTGNISGIYDTFGGANEYVMGVIGNPNGNPIIGRNILKHSGFNGAFGCPSCDGDSGQTEFTDGVTFPIDGKYYDLYSYSENSKDYQRGILGDGTGETGPFASSFQNGFDRLYGSWNYNDAWNVYHGSPWFIHSSLFGFGSTYGMQRADISFRIVLAV